MLMLGFGLRVQPYIEKKHVHLVKILRLYYSTIAGILLQSQQCLLEMNTK